MRTADTPQTTIPEDEWPVISSVVPQLTDGMRAMIGRQTGTVPLLLSASVDAGIEIATDRPDAVGTNLIANAVADYARFESNCVVVNFGTATTLAAAAVPGVFRGAVIAVGLQVTANALVGGVDVGRTANRRRT